MFSRARFDEDFYHDQAMVRRIKRTLQAQAQQDLMDEDEDDEGDGDEDVVVRGHKRGPGGRAPKVEKRERL